MADRDIIIDRAQRERLRQNIRVLRAYHDINVGDLASETLNTKELFTTIENHLAKPVYLDRIKRVADFFKIELDDLLEKNIQISFHGQ